MSLRYVHPQLNLVILFVLHIIWAAGSACPCLAFFNLKWATRAFDLLHLSHGI